MFDDEKITMDEMANDAPVILEFLEYLRWLAATTPNAQLSARRVWELYTYGVRDGRVWSDVCEELGLPLPEGWA